MAPGDYEAFEARVIADYDGQSEALTRAGADLSLSRLFLDPKDQLSKGSHTNAFRKEYISQTFVRLTEMPTCLMSRLNRYEHILWRQARQIVMTLRSLRSPSRGQRIKGLSSCRAIIASTIFVSE
jgi:hypothetical protein